MLLYLDPLYKASSVKELPAELERIASLWCLHAGCKAVLDLEIIGLAELPAVGITIALLVIYPAVQQMSSTNQAGLESRISSVQTQKNHSYKHSFW